MKTATELWNNYNEYYRYFPSVRFGIDISRMNFSPSFFKEMEQKTQRAFAAMQELEKGAIANPDEKRMVGHYWLRAPNLAPENLRKDIVDGIAMAEEFAIKIHAAEIKPEKASRFRRLLVIGIGGSALGPQLITEALGDLYRGDKGLRLSFLDNTDPDGIQKTLSSIDLRETLTVVISKSGGTVETKNGMLEAEAAYTQVGLKFNRQAIAVTMHGSALFKHAQSQDWLEIFPMFDWVGGRTSLFSAVGLVPVCLEGIPAEEFVSGAAEMDAVTRSTNVQDNPAALLALMWFHAGGGKGLKDMVILPYKDRLVLFSKYLQQLVMESIGKEHDLNGAVVNQGLAVYGNKGSTDQHAYVQQLRDGINNFFATFIEVLSDYTLGLTPKSRLEVKEGITSGDYLNGFFLGTRAALYEKGRESITLTIDSLSPFTLGALIALYERAVGFYASYVGINAYHQPGVEAGKKAAERVVDIQQKLMAAKLSGEMTAQEVAEKLSVKDEIEVVYKILLHLSADRRGVSVKRGSKPVEDKFSFSC